MSNGSVIRFGNAGDGRLPFEQQLDSFQMSPFLIGSTNITLTHSAYAGRTGVFNAAAGAVVTLPRAMGMGGKFRFVCSILITGNAKIQVGNTDDVMQGPAFGLQDGGDTVEGWECAAGSDTFNMNGSTQGGLKGDWVEFEDVAVGMYAIHCGITQTGTQATPFSSAV